MSQQLAAPGGPTHAENGMWWFILADLVIFAMYFWVFAWDRSLHPQQFIDGQATLDTTIGGANTIILLVSSYFMARAVHAARLGDGPVYARHILLTIACGCLFLALKAFEYSAKFSAGYHVATNVFYRDYFAFTGLHMLHVIFGLCLLVHARRLRHQRAGLAAQGRFIENVGLYWHMVDLLWVVLFALIYLAP